MSGTREKPAVVDAVTRGASRFYWAWLIFATTVSVLGNITHSLLVAPDALRLLAAVASVVPPTFVVGSTHAVALSLRMRRLALVYVLGLVMTISVAACAFFLSFDALRALAVMLGWPSGTAWLFPIVIDVSIAQATFGLLSLSPVQATSAAQQPTTEEHQSARTLSGPVADVGTPPMLTTSVPAAHDRAVVGSGRPPRTPRNSGQAAGVPVASPTVSMSKPKRVFTQVGSSLGAPIDTSDFMHWKRIADELVRNRTTSKDPETVATILAEHAAGTPRSTIGRRLGVHHSTVGRILARGATQTG
jgi:Protein of unknown function (DUF2637)